ncbi:hypothetical protein SISSUDRAFT_681877 [Sistotremastrum suecicum HHB10207 ss-3]|uniref:Uncharacterized protein n=1 Tax=Sistotremastrum suecicum HHB10207 ss-3 TaxID=1314776 RepID=A0A166I0P9_9AGAM|nr:hypothetical protein SISSUDRAFT_681877 [Sistotremastrum suecicum HHB10207 ss-3]
MDKVATTPPIQTPDSLDIMARSAAKIVTAITNQSLPEALRPQVKSFLSSVAENMIPRITSEADGHTLRDLMEILSCLGEDMGESEYALKLLQHELLDRRFSLMVDTSRLTLLPTFVGGLAKWLSRSTDAETNALILRTFLRVVFDAAAALNYDVAQKGIDIMLSSCQTEAYMPLGGTILQHLSLAIQEKFDEGDKSAIRIFSRMVRSVEKLVSEGWDFTVPSLAPAWTSVLKCGVRIVAEFFPVNGFAKAENFSNCTTCNEALLERAKRSLIAANTIADVKYWLAKAGIVKTILLLVSQEDDRKKILGPRYYLSLCNRMGWNDPLVHNHTHEPQGYSQLTETPMLASQSLPVPPVVPTVAQAHPSADLPQARRVLSRKQPLALRTGTLSTVPEADAHEEQHEILGSLVPTPTAPTTTLHPTSQPRPSISLPSTPSTNKKAQTSRGVLSPIRPNRDSSTHLSPPVKSPPFAWRGMNSQAKPTAAEKVGRVSGSQNMDLLKSPTNAIGLKRGGTESPEGKENSRRVKKARTEKPSSSTAKPVRQRATSAGPSSATPHDTNVIRTHNRAQSSTAIPRPSQLPIRNSGPAPPPTSLPQPSSRSSLQAAFELQDEQVFRYAPLGRRYDTTYDSGESSPEPSPKVPFDVSSRRPIDLTHNPTTSVQCVGGANYRYPGLLGVATMLHAGTADHTSQAFQEPRTDLPFGDTSTGAEDWGESYGAQPGTSNLTDQKTTAPAPIKAEDAQEAVKETREIGEDSKPTRRKSSRQPKPIRR